MKTITQKIIKTLLLITIYCSLNTALAQAPNAFSYQAVVRNGSNQLVTNANVGIKISIQSSTTTVYYSETHNATTNENGLVTIQIGNGTVVSGGFDNVPYSTESIFIKTEIDPFGSTNYSITSTTQLLSVPYALNSGDNKWKSDGNDILNNNTGKVKIGTPFFNFLNTKLDIYGDSYTTGTQYIFSNSTLNFDKMLFTFSPFSNDTGIQSRWSDQSMNFINGGNTVLGVNLFSEKVGIGVDSPTEKLDVAGKTKTTDLQVTNNASVGSVLTSDSIGNATWQIPSVSFSGTNNQITKFSGSTIIDSQINDNGTIVKIQPAGYTGFSPNTHKVQIAGSNNALHIIGNLSEAAGGKISFGVNSIGNGIPDSYIEEDYADALTIFGNQRIAIMSNGVGIGTTTPTAKLEVNGFTKLGTDAPAIKVKKIIGFTNPAEGQWFVVAHGLNSSKILSITALVEFSPGSFIPASYTGGIGYQFDFYVDGTQDAIFVINKLGNSSQILSKPFKIMITYEE